MKLLASSVKEALACASNRRIDFVISDLGLPDDSDIDLMTKLNYTRGLRGIALTGYGRRRISLEHERPFFRAPREADQLRLESPGAGRVRQRGLTRVSCSCTWETFVNAALIHAARSYSWFTAWRDSVLVADA